MAMLMVFGGVNHYSVKAEDKEPTKVVAEVTKASDKVIEIGNAVAVGVDGSLVQETTDKTAEIIITGAKTVIDYGTKTENVLK